jgi:hypothetical protein
MHTMTATRATSVGDRAVDFVVPAVDGSGSLALADFTGRQPLFLGVYRGLHCPFCRRHLAQLDLIRAKLELEAAARTESWPVQTTIEEFLSHRINPTGEMEAPVNPLESNDVLNARDGFRLTEADEQVRARHGTQLVGMFLIGREGIIRWRFVEGEATPADIGRFPTPQQIVDAAAALPR